MSAGLAAADRRGSGTAERAPRAGVAVHSTRAGPRVAWTLAGLAGAACLAALRSEPSLAGWLPACAFRETFGIGCVTCGFTSALAHLARGELGASFVAHPLALPVALEGVFVWLAWGLGAWTGRPALRGAWVVKAAAFTAIAALLTWAARLATGTLPS